MATVTKADLIEQTREYMDAVSSSRWTDSLISTVLGSVFDAEWSNILNAAPFYKFAKREITTASDGTVPLSSLSTGSGGDTEQNFYRILSVSDGNVLYEETDFSDVPLATTTNYLPSYPRLFYVAGDNVQVLPSDSAVDLIVYVNWKPTTINDLSSDLATFDFPDNAHLILVWEAAAQLLLKGGAETAAAGDMRSLARLERVSMLDDIRRRTINATRMAYPDLKYEWAGG
jgi:hypothetical protein